jgi:hypothetical protein
MLKRTKGRFLLTLLVITGMAGTLKDSTLTQPERKFALTELKDTKNEVLKSVKGLSDAQLNYKASPDRWSITECIYHITLSEKALWDQFTGAMKDSPKPDERKEIKVSDEELIRMVKDRSKKVQTFDQLKPETATWKELPEALGAFKAARTDHIKYAKSTTEDLRNHIIQLPFGKVDAYQFILFVAAHSDRHLQQINEIKAYPGFPKK